MSERVCEAIRVEIRPIPTPPGYKEIREFVHWPFLPRKEGQLVYLDEGGFPPDYTLLQKGQRFTEQNSGQLYEAVSVRLYICRPTPRDSRDNAEIVSVAHWMETGEVLANTTS